ncbi:MAG: hypothetical protein R8M11_06215 [Gallionella sp.]
MINKEAVLQTLKCLPNQYPQILAEKYPHVLEEIVKHWNSPDCEAYLADLLHPTYSGGRFDRTGFPEKAWHEILRLTELYNKSRPE